MSLYETFYRSVLFPLFVGGVRGKKTLSYLRALEESQWWDRGTLRSQQLRALQGLLRHAWETCPYYRRAWEQHGLDVRSVQSLDDFQAWPVVTREDVRRCKPEMLSTGNSKLIHSATGGSTGEPMEYAFDTASAERRAAVTHRGYDWAGAGPGKKRLYIWGTEVGRVPWRKRCKSALVSAVKREKVLSCFDFTEANMRRYAGRLNAYRPDVIVAYTNPIYEFARFLDHHGIQPYSPRSIVVGAERLHDFQRRQIEAVFHAPVFETYGSREFLLIASECDHHRGLHVSAENLLVEVLGDDGQPLPDGEEGNVVITDLYNYGMPLVRYANGDRAVAGWGRCPCGRGLPLVRELRGRRIDVLATPSGRRIPGEFFPHMMKDFPNVRRFQVVQHAVDAITIKVVAGGTFTRDEEAQIRDACKAGAGDDVRVELEVVDDIPLTRTGKLQVVVRAGDVPLPAGTVP